MLSCFSCVELLVTPWNLARQAPLSMGFSRQECWGGLPCPSPGNLPDPGIEPESLVFPALQADSWPTKLCGKAIYCYILRTWNTTWVIGILKLIYFRWSTIPTSETLKTALRMRRSWLSSWALPCSLPLSGCWPWGRPAAGMEVSLWRGPIRPENSLTSDLGDDLVLVEPSDETLESWLTVGLASHEKSWARGTHLSYTWIPEPQ